MKWKEGLLGVLVLGLFLIALSYAYPTMSGSREANWSEEDAQEFQELGRRVHNLDYEFARERAKNPKAEPSPEFARAADLYQQKEQQLKEAQNAGQFMARVLFIAGITLVVVAGVC